MKLVPKIFEQKYSPVLLGKKHLATLDQYIIYMRTACSHKELYKWGGFLGVLAVSVMYQPPVHVHIMDIILEFIIYAIKNRT